MAPASNKPQYSQIAIVPDFKPQRQKPIRKTPRINTANLSRGINRSGKRWLSLKRMMNYTRELKKLIYTINNGESDLQTAASKAGVSMQLIRRLQELGSSNSNSISPKIPVNKL